MATKRSVNVGIVDDSARDRSLVESLLRRFEDENSLSFQIRHYDDGAALLDNYQPNFDVIFLDIKMSGLDGMSTAAAIRSVDSKVILIFVTNTAQYATHGYSVSALSYLLKPVSYFAFRTEMDRCLAALDQLREMSILVGSGTSLRRLDITDFVFLESNRHRISVHTANETISFSGTLKSFEDSLSAHSFYRANSGYLLNLRHLRAIHGEDAILSDGSSLKISRSRKKGLMDALMAYVGGPIQ